jgi:ubiquinone/menaquinone biosynthesis C-methylase UbiE
MDSSHWRNLYVEHSDLYDELVRYEDYENNLIATLAQLHPLDQAEAVEFGAGTGRITAQLARRVGNIRAFDLTPTMLRRAHQKLSQATRSNWRLGLADSRAMPAPAACADLAVEGWSFVQMMMWHIETWRTEGDRALSEMMRLLRPGGVAILIETLGTGETTPNPPERFIPIYTYFEQDWNFSRTWIRTDYRFPARAEAQATVEPVFGEAMLDRLVEAEGSFILPECTGLWWRHIKK